MSRTPLYDLDIEMFVALVPEGEQNAIKRDDLTRTCVDMGLIHNYCKDKDRAMRKLLQRARIDHCIITRTGGGYYRPFACEWENISKHRQTEIKRAKSTFMSVKYDGKLAEDYQKGRITE